MWSDFEEVDSGGFYDLQQENEGIVSTDSAFRPTGIVSEERGRSELNKVVVLESSVSLCPCCFDLILFFFALVPRCSSANMSFRDYL